MKDKKNRTLKIALLIVLPILVVIGILLSFLGAKSVKKTYAVENNIGNISQYADPNDNPTSVSIILEYLDFKDKSNISDNEVKLSAPDGITLSFYNIDTNAKINTTDNKITIPEEGVILKVEGISLGNKYDITITPSDKRKGYKAAYKEVIIEVDYETELKASIKSIKNYDDTEEELSENEKAVFLYTDDEDKIRFRANEDVEISYYYSTTELTDDELNNKEFTVYDKSNYLQVSTNGYLYARSKYKTDGYSKISKLHITNIDKLSPVVTVDSIVESNTHDSALITYKVNDATATAENGKSGIQKYAFSSTNIEDNVEYIDVSGDGTYTQRVYDNRIYYVFAIDNAGNKTIQEIEVNQITFYQDEMVVFIISSTNSDLVGKAYSSLQAMKDDFDAHNLTNQDKVVAQIEADIKNQYIDVENVNLTLDLNGYEIYSREEHPTFDVKAGATLKVVDNKIDIDNTINYKNKLYVCSEPDDSEGFDFKNDEEVYYPEYDGFYEIRLWGAQGGGTNGGYGGFTQGRYYFSKDEPVYINVGGQGGEYDGGYNGGGQGGAGNGQWSYGGGGATSITTTSGLLYTHSEELDKVVMIAAGGGGSGGSSPESIGGAGGGFKGVTGYDSNSRSYTGYNGTGANYDVPGYAYKCSNVKGSFGKGGDFCNSSYGGAGGGAGFYGGGGSNRGHGGGGGGSSYIANEDLFDKYSYCYNCETNNETNKKTLSTGTNSCHSSNPQEKCSKEGNGYATIAYIPCIPVDKITHFDHGDNLGTINNIYHDAILVEDGGTFIMGEDNSPDLAHIEVPETTSPLIQGKEKGITNRGTFKFYDGMVYGGVAIDGITNETPNLYDPLLTLDEDTENYKMILSIVANVEALIGKTRYTLLEDAIAAANDRKGTPDDQIKIDIVKDLAKTETVDISDSKNILLDLNGHTVTSSNNGPVFNNYGKTSIMDSGETGRIFKDNDNTIQNNSYSVLSLESGTIDNSYKGGYSIVNNEHSTVNINNGVVTKVSDGSPVLNYGIFNFNDGTIIKNGGGGPDINNQGGELFLNKGKIICNQSASPVLNYDLSSSMDVSNIQYISPNSFTPRGNYPLVVDETNQILQPERYDVRYQTYTNYYILDLRSYSSLSRFKLSFKVKANLPDNIYGYFYARNDSQTTNYSNSYNKQYRNTNGDFIEDSYIYEGGKIYYLNFGYYKNNNNPVPDDIEFLIKDIEIKEYILNAGKVEINKDVTYESNFGSTISIYNYSSYDGFIVNYASLSAGQLYNYNGKMTIHDGEFKQLYNYNNGTIDIDKGTFEKIDNRAGTINISDGTFNTILNSSRYETSYSLGGIDFSTNNTSFLNINGGTYNQLINVYYANIKNAKVVGTFTNYSILDTYIKDSVFEVIADNYHEAINSVNIISNEGNTIFDNCEFNGELTSNSTSYGNTNSYGSYYGINKEGNSILTINDSSINISNIKRDPSKTNIRLNTSRSPAVCIYDNGSGSINVENTTCISNSDAPDRDTYGIQLNNIGILQLGKKDGNYNHDSVVISAGVPIINRDGKIMFYDGVLKGTNNYLNSTVSDVEDGYFIHTYEEDSYKVMDLTQNNESVLHVETNNKYSSLYDAITNTTGDCTFKYLNDVNYETNKITIPEGRKINVHLNNKKVFFGQGILNNGELKMYDEEGNTANINTHQIINNSILNINSGKYVFEIDSTNGLVNNGSLNITNSSLFINSDNKNNLILNNNIMYFKENALLSLGDYTRGRTVYNNIDAKLYINGGTIDATSVYNWGSRYYGKDSVFNGRAIYNYGGYVELNSGDIKVFGRSSDEYYYGTTNGIHNVSTTGTNIAGYENYNVLNNGWIPVDLTGYSGDVTVETKYYTQYRYDTGEYNVYIRDEQSIPSGTQPDIVFPRDGKRHTFTNVLQGGKVYYYYINNSYVYLHSIKIIQNDEVVDLHHRATININGGNIIETGHYNTIYSENAVVNMTGGNIKRESGIASRLEFDHGSEFNMSGGQILDFGTAIYTSNYGSYISLTGGKITYSDLTNNLGTNAVGIDANYSTVNMNNFLINIPGTGILTSYYSDVNITDSIINMTGNNDQYGLNLRNYTNCNIDNTSIIASSSNKNAYGITTSDPINLNIKNTDIQASAPTANKTSVGVNTSNNTVLTLSNDDGNDDGKVSQINPSIKGDTYGVITRGTFNYYDGILKGDTPLSGGINDKPLKYELLYGTEDDLNTVVLQKTVVVINTDTNEEYGLLQDGIDDCTDNQICNLKILYPIDFTDIVEVGKDKKINLDLNEKILSCTEQKNLVNKGELTITNGTIKLNNVKDHTAIIDNYGKLTLGNGSILDMNSNYFARGLMNRYTGEVYIENGSHIKADSASVPFSSNISGRTIYNQGGYIEMNGGVIDTASIYGYSNCSGCLAFNNTSFVTSSFLDNVVVTSEAQPNTSGYLSSTSGVSYYIPFDLTEYHGEVNLEVRYTYSQSGDPVFYSTSINSSDYSSRIKTSEIVDRNGSRYITLKVLGGSKYYLHGSGYSKIFDAQIIQGDNVESYFHRAKFVMNGGTINGRGGRDYFVVTNSDFELNGGTISGNTDTDTAININDSSNFTMNGGIIQNKQNGISATGSVVTINGGKILNNNAKATNGINVSNSSTLTINDILIDGIYSYSLYLSGTNADIKGGTYKNSSTSSTDAAIYISDKNRQYYFENINVDAALYGLYLQDSNVDIKNSTIKGGNTAINCRFNNECNVNISNDDEEVSTNSSKIISDNVGINHTAGNINFYDGIIIAPTPVNGGINSIPDDYSLVTDTIDEKNVMYLDQNNIIMNKDTNIGYYRIQDAINECSDDCNLKVLMNYDLVEQVTIPNNKRVDLDVNKKTLSIVGHNSFINKGTLLIRNGNIYVKSVIDTTAIIDNFGNLYIEDGAYLDNTGYLRSRILYNHYKSNVYINGGTIRNKNTTSSPDYFYNVYGGTIYNAGGYIEINGGTFDVNSYRSFYYQNIGAAYIYAIYNVRTVEDYYVYYNSRVPNINDGYIFGEYTGIYVPVDLTDKEGSYYITISSYGTPYLCNNMEENGTSIPSIGNETYKTRLLTGGNKYYLRFYSNGFAAHFGVYDIIVSNEDETESYSLFERGKIVINDGTINSYGELSFITSGNSDVEMNGGTIQNIGSMAGPAFGLNNGSKLQFNDGLLLNRKNAIAVSNSYAKLTGGEIETNIGYGGSAVNVSGGTVDIENTKMNLSATAVYDSEKLYGINIENGTVNFKSGKLITNNGSNSVGIRLASNNSVINLGTNEGLVSESTPSIKGDVYGIQKYNDTGTINFYDGIVTSPNKPIYGDIDDMPLNYKLTVEGDSYILRPKSSIENTFEYNGMFFEKLDMAIEMINNTESKTGLIKVWNDVSLNSSITIPEGTNITLALEDHEITFDNVEVGIINNGTLTIIDGETDEIDNDFRSKIENVNGTVIENNGSLTLGATGMSNPNSPIITGYVGVTGNTPTIVSGSIESTSTGLIQTLANMGRAIIRFFTNLLQPTYAYKTNDYQVNNLNSNVALADKPIIRAVDPLDTWTNNDINIAMTAHNYGVLNIASSVNENEMKELNYKVFIYKDDVQDENETVEKTKTVQYLEDEILEVDKNYFESVHSKYDGYYLNKVYLNDNELDVNDGVVEIEPTVDNNSVFKLYFKKIPVTTTTTTTESTTTTSTTKKKSNKPSSRTTKKTTTQTTTTSESKTTTKRTTTEEVKGDEVIIKVKEKKPFPWWIVWVSLGVGAFFILLLQLLPLLLRRSVLVAISGGVGSAVAAKILKERKYKVHGLFINDGYNVDSLIFAKQICDKLKIELYEVDINNEYKSNMISELTDGIGNKDIDTLYNKYIIIPMLRDVAKDKKIKYIATGTYASIDHDRIVPGKNNVFDESDTLSEINDIKNLVLPLGDIDYQDVNKIADNEKLTYNTNPIDKLAGQHPDKNISKKKIK